MEPRADVRVLARQPCERVKTPLVDTASIDEAESEEERDASEVLREVVGHEGDV